MLGSRSILPFYLCFACVPMRIQLTYTQYTDITITLPSTLNLRRELDIFHISTVIAARLMLP